MTAEDIQSIRTEINERLKMGVPIEAILSDLKERSIDMFELNKLELEYEIDNENDIQAAEREIKGFKSKYKWSLVGTGLSLFVIILSISMDKQLITGTLIFTGSIISAFDNRSNAKKWEKYLEDLNVYMSEKNLKD